MAMKAISGIIWTLDHREGSVRVKFDDELNLEGDIPNNDHYHRAKCQINKDRSFTVRPCHIVALHQLNLLQTPCVKISEGIASKFEPGHLH